MKKIDICLIIGLITAIIFANASAFIEQYNGIRENVVRLHILANSDSDEDQALKLKVRDAVLEEAGSLFSECSSISEVESKINENIHLIEDIAKQTITENGYDYPVKCSLLHMDFDTRVYENFTMPAGDYDALRITIGEAEGHNWWCVMYPPLCIPAAMDVDEFEDEFTKEEIDILKNPEEYKVKFKCVEVYQSLKEKLKKLFDEKNNEEAQNK